MQVWPSTHLRRLESYCTRADWNFAGPIWKSTAGNRWATSRGRNIIAQNSGFALWKWKRKVGAYAARASRLGLAIRMKVYIINCRVTAPQQSNITSHGEEVRLCRKDWWSSSALATRAVPSSARPASGKKREWGRLIHQARSQARLIKP